MGIKTETAMTLDYFNVFYVLEALQAKISTFKLQDRFAYSRAVERLETEIQEYSETVLPKIAQRTFMYLWASCIGEARHAARPPAKSNFIPQLASLNRGACFEIATSYKPTIENINTVVQLFTKQSWRSAFGGANWGRIAKACLNYYNSTPHEFLDHVIDLEHNSGTVFSKEESDTLLSFRIKYHGGFKYFMDWKFSSDILRDNPDAKFYVTFRVGSFLNRYSTIFGEPEVKWFVPILNNLTDYEIEWGDGVFTIEEKWCEWYDCSAGNEPNTRYMLNQVGLSDISYTEITEKEFRKQVKYCVREAKRKFARYYTDDVDKKAKLFFESHSRYCRAEKASKTFSALPCMVHFGSTTTFQFPVPYFGVGKETEYGFEVSFDRYIDSKLGTDFGYDGSSGFYEAVIKTYGTDIMAKTFHKEYVFKNKELESILV